MAVISYLDTILVPLSFFLAVGYHAYLWRIIRTKPSTTAIGADALKRKSWFLALDAGDDKKGMLAVQSLRNTLMVTILTATISVLVYMALAALINNSFTASSLFSSPFFGSASPKIVALKYGSASLFLASSFLCSSMAVGFLVDANYLINTPSPGGGSRHHSRAVFERGFVMAILGNRLLCLTVPALMWTFGPVPAALSSGALVWVLYELDFVGRTGGFAGKRSLDGS
ncbi:hypothetical protein SAY87_009214 [Trapa incisa]|uniref:Uncharacterized protein n=2 Tax=Trapa TaxID=22665 RepID=A0AAN7M3W1_TRANT|nr:hypothetical protein SAY87_009214 [Trapa incisa]KAK4798735.1 hypothetical protein SAY86_031061 [Trapa natans]